MRLSALFLFISIFCSASASHASSWNIVCSPECKLGQLVVADGRVVSQVIIQDIQNIEIIEVLLPLEVSLLNPIFIQVDGGSRYDVQIATCRPMGCIGIVENPNPVIDQFRRGLDMKLWFTGFDDGTTYYFPYDLRGFTAAYEEYHQN